MDELFSVFQGQAYSSSDDDEEMSLEVEEGQDEEVHSRGNRNGAEIQSKIRTTKSIRERRNKRHVDGARKNGLFQPNGHSEGDVDMDRAIPTSSDDEPDRSLANLPDDRKRRKKDFGPAPVLTDAFQTAQSREVAVDGGFEAPEQAETEAGALVLSHNIQHQVALPPDLDYEYVPLSKHKPPDKPARTWDFKLDPFQTLSVASIERDESVLVSAHTSAGKTVVAEYAIAQCLQRNQRVVYTSPIKALSNQKYRDFEAIFGDVGLMTGDVTINPSASCLVMTTEILRSMLYRGSEVMREVAWVVFDEIHYMRDKIRGVVWEEAIILLPDKVRYVFLSATIPNAFQFAEWIAKIHHQACHVVYTDFRPTPLQNYFYPAGSKGLYLVVDEKGVFKEHSFNAAMRAVEEGAKVKSDANRRGGKTKSRKQTKADDDKNSPILNVIRNIMKRKYHPVIVFNFSKRECEAMAMTISQMRLTTEVERGMVRTVFGNALESLPEADRGLPHLTNLLPLLEKGIGVHHGGLLPILKETIEILFQESLVKVLFATETFSIGLNMPAKTVVFSQVKKWDGIQTRPLTSSEYIQMSGRAGRRGLDTRGIVIMMVDDKIESDTFKQIVVGHQDRLNSAFYLGHNMVLNLLRIEAVSPEFMLERCFHQFQNAANVPALEKELAGLQQARDGMVIPDESTVKDYHSIRQQLTSNVREMRRVIQLPENCRDFLQDGRMVQVNNPEDGADDVTDGRDFGWGVVVGKTPRRGGPDEFRPQESIVVDVFLPIAADSAHFAPGRVEGNMPKGLKPRGAKDEGQCAVVPCLLTCITCIGQVRVLTPKADRWTDVERLQLEKSLEEVKRRFPDGLPPLDPLLNMGISDSGFKKTLRKIEVLEARLSANPLHGSTLLPQRWEQYREKHKLEENIKEQKKAIARAHTITQMDELKARKRVLRRLGFINEHEVVQLKGRVACEIAATEGHELLLTELLFDRFFNELTPEQCAAMLSVFILDETLESQPLKEDLAKSYRGIVAKARIIVKISQESKIELNEDDYVKGLKWQLIEVVHAWASGASFKTICEMTNAFEGSLIRLFRRLEEVLRQMSEGAKVMGSTDLAEKFNEGMTRIRRDIVAAQSLYL